MTDGIMLPGRSVQKPTGDGLLGYTPCLRTIDGERISARNRHSHANESGDGDWFNVLAGRRAAFPSDSSSWTLPAQ